MRKGFGFAAGLLAGCLLTAAVPAGSAAVKQYVLVKASYPVHVNGVEYDDKEKPILNYDGTTYVPLRAVGGLLGADVGWNEAEKRVEITNGQEPQQNNAYRAIRVSGSDGNYVVKGEARVFEAVMSYAVSDGHRYLLEKNLQLSEGAPEWSAFTLEIRIPAEQLPVNGTLTLELFEYSAQDGSRINLLNVPLESFP